ncbi:MAG: hypothetical protein AAB414_02825 [Patescibacteria group bacterium]
MVNILDKMDESQNVGDEKIAKKFSPATSSARLLLGVCLTAAVLGLATGYILSSKGASKAQSSLLETTPKTAQQDSRTFRDFAEGTIKARPEPSDEGEYVEGTHILMREGTVPVALTSSVVDLSLYEGKKVKVFGETQKALKEGWLMDVGKVEETK